LESTRKRVEFQVLGYVHTPERVHLLLSEPDEKRLSRTIQVLLRRMWAKRLLSKTEKPVKILDTSGMFRENKVLNE
jgi:hypothetical protein